MTKSQQKLIGAFEKVSFPEFGISEVTAKIDTGAYTGAFHATKISETTKEGQKVLKFSPFDHPTTVFETSKYTIRPVKSSNGHEENRFAVNTEITVNGATYPIRLTLANRSEMTWPVLIGRRFLRKNDLLVDVTRINK